MSLSDFSLFLPGSTNNKNTPGSKNIISKNQVNVDIQKIQSNFKKLIDTIITLINDKKRLETELSNLKTTSQKQKNISSTAKNSQELIKYIGILDNYLIEVNKTLKDYPNEKSKILSEIQQRINKNFGGISKNLNNSTGFQISEKINIGVTPKANNSGAFLPNKNFESLSGQNIQLKNNKFASTLEELMGVNYEPNNNKTNSNSSNQETLFLNNKKVNSNSSIQESLFLNTKVQEENNKKKNRRNENNTGNIIDNNVSEVLGNVGNQNRNSGRTENNVREVLGNVGNQNRNSGRTENNVSEVLGNTANVNSTRTENNSNRNKGNIGNLNSNNRNRNNNNSGKSLTNFLSENNRNNRVVEVNEEEENVEEEPQQPQNTNKSIFTSIGETLGLTTPVPKNNSNSIKTNMKKAKCEGEDCDIFSEDIETAEINAVNLGKNFKNGENRYNNARKKIMKLLGEQITTSKANNRGKISNFPREGDITTYLEET